MMRTLTNKWLLPALSLSIAAVNTVADDTSAGSLDPSAASDTTCYEVLPGEDGVKESLKQIAQAFNEEDVALYARNATENLLNMIVYEVGGRQPKITYDLQARLEELDTIFANNPFNVSTSVKEREIYVADDRAFAIFDVSQTAKPKNGNASEGFNRTLDIYLFLRKEPCIGWQTERSMTIPRSKTALRSENAK